MTGYKLGLVGIFIFFFSNLFTQSFDIQMSLDKVLDNEYQKSGTINGDKPAYFIRDFHYSEHSDTWHIYINQLYNDIPVDQAITSVHLNGKGQLVYLADRFISDKGIEAKKRFQAITPENAVSRFTGFLGIQPGYELVRTKTRTPFEEVFHPTRFSRGEILTGLCYKQLRPKNLVPTWKIEFLSAGSSESWTAWVHAENGELLEYRDGTLHCSFDPYYLTHEDRYATGDYDNHQSELPEHPGLVNTPMYRVFPLPVESPIHGSQMLVPGPDSNEASPFGWHDTDGLKGPEFQITRGNNVHAFEDRDGNEMSMGNEPNGGEQLNFDFEFDPVKHPQESLDAIVTNLFYTNNLMHDFLYKFGFDEEAGNFQENNYGRGGEGGDYVIAQALAHEEDSDGQPLTNNANFIPSRDGSHGVMNMFLWNLSATANRIQLVSPEEISGPLESSEARFGSPVGAMPLSGKIVITNDGVSHLTDACQDIVNGDELNGNIALIDRGICEFGSKVLNAQENGAIAAIICNVAGVNGGTGDELLSGGMGAGVDGTSVSIPSLFLKKSDCDLIKMVIHGGSEVEAKFQLVNPPTGPSQLASSLDNGIITHEYAHGISNRLTGGSTSTGCLSNDEQMGEGWSDFFALVLTHQDGDLGPDVRGIGNYVIKAAYDGRGIRRFPYSTDMSVNPLTYNLIRGTTSPHSLGEVWAACLWDMYWEFIDIYGFDPSWQDSTSGNFRAVQLVVDGLIYQGCSPGFVDGRDGILAADQVLYEGAHQCLIWSVFARRGVGNDAFQGSPFNRNDNEEGFEPLPTCIKELKIRKTATDIVDAGDDIEVHIRIANHKEEVLTGVNFVDKLEEGMVFLDNLSGFSPVVESQSVSFDLGTLQPLQEVELVYTLSSDELKTSHSLFLDDFEGPSITLIQLPLQQDNYEWQLVDLQSYSGDKSWFIPNDTTILDQALVTSQSFLVTGGRPVLKFWHMYETEFGFDGGFVEISKDDGLNWEPVRPDQFLKNGYNSQLDFFTFAIPGQLSFTGDSEGWIESYIDLSEYSGKEILVRFRFGCNTSLRPSGENKGWYIDDYEFLDLISYNQLEACVSSAEGDLACDMTNILVRSAGTTTPVEEIFSSEELLIYPNPARETIFLQFNRNVSEEGVIQMMTVNGAQILSQELNLLSGRSVIPIEIGHLPEGIYWMRILTESKGQTTRIVKF